MKDRVGGEKVWSNKSAGFRDGKKSMVKMMKMMLTSGAIV